MRYALRSILRAPWFSATAVALLGAGIGANVLIFTAVDALLLRPLAVRAPERLVRLGVERSAAHTMYEHAAVYARVIRERTAAFSEVFTTEPLEGAAVVEGRAVNARAEMVSAGYFRDLGVTAELGSVAAAEDAPVAVVSHRAWLRWFGGRGDVVGRGIRLRGAALTLVGVVREGFDGLDLDNRTDLWVTPAVYLQWIGKPADVRSMPANIYMRVREGVPVERAEAEIRAAYPAMVAAEYEGQRDMGADVVKQEQLLRPVLAEAGLGVSTLRKQFTGAVKALMGGVAALFLLVCGNVSGLMLARADAHRRDALIRLSLGASRWGVARRALAEAGALAAAGGVLGFAIARWCGPWLLGFLPARRPLGIELRPDGRVLGFAIGAAVLAAVLSSVLPALSLYRADVAALLGRQSLKTTAPRVSRGLVAFQAAVATLLAAGSFTLVRTMYAIRDQDPGFRRERLVVMTVDPWTAGLRVGKGGPLVEEAVRRARGLPGVEEVSVAQRALMRGIGFKANVGRDGHRIAFADSLNASLNGVSENHFANMGMRILAGRGFTEADAKAKPLPVVVSRSFARQFFGDGDPVGQAIGTASIGSVVKGDRVIVGVVSDAKYRGMREVPPPTVYTPVAPGDFDGAALHVRVRRDPAEVMAALRAMLAGVGPGLTPAEIGTMEQDIETSVWQERLLAALSGLFAGVAVALASIGLFGMLAFAVSRRTREIGIRMAIGATAGRVASMVGRDALWAVAPGVLLGLASYAVLARVMESLLYGVSGRDPGSLAGAAVCVAVAGAVAAAVPLVRAVRIEPAAALRDE
ncbi:MAG: ABC transporter permease [Acidobacteria bacterium]|nr:ABC transporter permease [Acidobacteriota bacterium]